MKCCSESSKFSGSDTTENKFGFNQVYVVAPKREPFFTLQGIETTWVTQLE